MKYLITEKQLKTLRKYMKTFINEMYMYDWRGKEDDTELLFDRLKELLRQFKYNWNYEFRDGGLDDWRKWSRKEDEIIELVKVLGDTVDSETNMTARELYKKEASTKPSFK